MDVVSDNKILDCNSNEFIEVFEKAYGTSKINRENPNKSTSTSYEGYCSAVDRVGPGLAEVAKKIL